MLQYVLMALIVLYGLYFNHTTSSTTSLAVVEEHQPKRTHMPSNKEILRKLKPVDITYLDVTGGPDIQKREYHHRGAQDEHGQYGYKPKLQALRLDPPSLNLTSDALVKACNIRDEEYNMIHEKITIYQPEKEGDKKQQYETKLLCVLQTVGHRHDRMTALRQTWAPKCDGFFVASNVTDPSLGTVRIPHKDDTDLAKQKWSRLISIWSFIYDNYYQDYDWFYISNNDVVFLLVENLRLYLESAEIKVASRYGIEQERQSEYQVPLFLGKRVAYDGNYNDVFNAAGPGYVLNKAALKRLVLDGANKPLVEPTSKEDLMLARAFRRIGVYPYGKNEMPNFLMLLSFSYRQLTPTNIKQYLARIIIRHTRHDGRGALHGKYSRKSLCQRSCADALLGAPFQTIC